MQLPKRRSQMLRRRDDQDGVVYLTPGGIQRIHDDIERLDKHERPRAIEDVSRSVQLGDLSENAEYQEAKSRLARIEGRLFHLRERLKRVVEIENGPNADGRVKLGSTVVLKLDDREITYHIVGPHEANPTRGRISHVSPLGEALLDHVAGDEVTIKTPNGESTYVIKTVAGS